jgi:hypothetical protein
VVQTSATADQTLLGAGDTVVGAVATPWLPATREHGGFAHPEDYAEDPVGRAGSTPDRAVARTRPRAASTGTGHGKPNGDGVGCWQGTPTVVGPRRPTMAPRIIRFGAQFDALGIGEAPAGFPGQMAAPASAPQRGWAQPADQQTQAKRDQEGREQFVEIEPAALEGLPSPHRQAAAQHAGQRGPPAHARPV